MKRRVKGAGLVNSVIDKLPYEFHLKGYNYCGPGTKLQERLARGDIPVNPLDEACKEHDIAYSYSKETEQRAKADRVLADKAWKRFKSKDVPWGEKIAAWFVTTGMNTKGKLGAGMRRRRKKTRVNSKKKSKGPVIPFGSIIRQGRMAIRGAGVKSPKQMRKATLQALTSIRKLMKGRRRKNIKWGNRERVLALPKTGGVLPLLPIFAGLSAIGSLAGGAAGVAKAVAEIRDARRQLSEAQRHNKSMEAIALRQGKGLYLKPYKKGLGLYMTPYVKHAKNL